MALPFRASSPAARRVKSAAAYGSHGQKVLEGKCAGAAVGNWAVEVFLCAVQHLKQHEENERETKCFPE